MIVVSDTSTLTNLYQVDQLHLLHLLYGKIIVPPGVRRELYRIDSQKAAIEQLDWVTTEYPKDQKLIAALLIDLDLGESKAIALAVELNSDLLIIDERKGRAIAENKGIRIAGLLGILVAAKKAGHIDTLTPVIKRLRANGFRLKATLIDKVLRILGEGE